MCLYIKGVEESGYGIRERTVRCPFTTSIAENQYHMRYVKKQLLNFLHSATEKKIEVFVTANIVLTDPSHKTFR